MILVIGIVLDKILKNPELSPITISIVLEMLLGLIMMYLLLLKVLPTWVLVLDVKILLSELILV
jgi:hypothetical protein